MIKALQYEIYFKMHYLYINYKNGKKKGNKSKIECFDS